jgi:hypothetical protein
MHASSDKQRSFTVFTWYTTETQGFKQPNIGANIKKSLLCFPFKTRGVFKGGNFE